MPTSLKTTLAIIDDDPELLQELAAALATDYRVVTGTAHPDILQQLRDDAPAAIILDLDLDDGDPFDLLRRITGDPQLGDAPVLVLSSVGDFATFERSHRAGAADYVTKPLSPDDLRPRLAALLSGRKRRGNGRLKLGDLLVASCLLTREQLDRALARQHDDGGRLGALLVDEGLVAERDIVTAVARQMRIGVVDLEHTAPQPAALSLLPRDFIVRRRLMPLSFDESGALVVAMTNPLDVLSIDEIGMRTKRRVRPVICTESGFDEAVAIYLSSRGKLKDARSDNADDPEAFAGEIDADIIDIVDALLTDAAAMGASDIHLEPAEESLAVRCRIDGVLHELREFPKDLQPGITSRLKIMADLNIAERRLPQDGRTTFELSSGEVIDLRLASIPSMHGENVTIRILEVSALPPTLSSLGLVGANLARYETALKAPEGGIAIVGPTGSGKSTTLYTTLELVKTPQRKIYTVEDPIERKIDGIIQTEVMPQIGLTFAHALRALVRADPDVIMVGEIRDLETAKMAADAAITGHQVFSTLHTNDASAAVGRLVEMGVARYLVAAAWRCFVAQRLVRRLCQHCRREVTITDADWAAHGLGPAPDEQIRAFEPVGCAKCFGTGYRGRIGLYEVLVLDEELRDAVASGANVQEIQHLARGKGVTSLRADGIAKVLDGSTSYLELLRVTI